MPMFKVVNKNKTSSIRAVTVEAENPTEAIQEAADRINLIHKTKVEDVWIVKEDLYVSEVIKLA